jgi:hypothetical protein
MGDVVQLRPKSLVEFENSALRKLVDLAEMATRVPEILASIEGDVAGVGEQETAKRFVSLLSILDEAIDALESFAPQVTQTMEPGERAIFEMQCELTRLRVTAFTSFRCSILYIDDFVMEGLEAVISDLRQASGGAA